MFYNLLRYSYRVFRVSILPRRILNNLKLSVSYGLSACGVLTRWKLSPAFISVEPANVCNLHCPECPVGMRTTPAVKSTLDFNLFKKLMDELSPGLMHVIFYFQGEPLLNPDFTEMVSYARSKNLLTSSSTNAQLITDELARGIVESGLDRLIISIDGATQDVYEKYRVGGSLFKALNAVTSLVKWKENLRSASPLIEIQFLVLSTNEHQMADMKRLARNLKADKLTFKSAQLYDFENGNELLPRNPKYARYELRDDHKYHIKSKLRNRCQRLWRGAVITSKGDVLPCCFDKESAFSFGNIHHQTFSACWNGPAAYDFRQKILQNRKQFQLCTNCTEK